MAGAAAKRIYNARQERVATSNTGRSDGRSTGGVSSGGQSSGPSRPMSDAPRSDTRSVRSSNGLLGPGDANADPADSRNPSTSRVQVDPKNFDLGMGAWSTVRGYDLDSGLVKRPGFSKLGQAKKIALNTFNVETFPEEVFQYEVLIGSGTEKRGLVQAVWDSNAVKQAIGSGWVFDGNRLAWNINSIDRDIKLTVNLDQERGKKPRKEPETHRVLIRRTNRVGFEVLRHHLEGKCAFDNTCLEAINCLDHLLREYPRLKYTAIKRAFFDKGKQRFPLGNGVEAFKGVYQSLRMTSAGAGQGARLSINLDVSNGTFFTESPLHIAAVAITGRRDVNDLITALKQGERGRAGQEMKRLRRIRVEAKHRGSDQVDQYVIDRFIYQSAREYKFPVRDEAKGTETMTSVYDYFAKKYNIRLTYPDLPLVKATKGKNTVVPMEILKIKENQRYPFKMDEKQTSNMIKFAVTPPAERWKAIEHGLDMLRWADDPVLKKYGMKVNPNKTIVEGRLLTAPKVQFNGGDAKPGTSGRWDLKAKKFLQPNSAPLKCWSVTVVSGRRGGKPDKAIIETFIREFCKVYTGHGGRIENKQPAMNLASGDDVGAWVTTAWNAAGNQSQARPQMLVFILPDKDSNTYGRIKRSAECRYGVVSQCMQYAHVQKCQAQYISNVCMKFNAKLGGITARAVGVKTGGPGGAFTTPTMVIGADVSHAAPGAQTPSMAALTFSMDKLCTRYAAACQTNGFRVEMITTDNINEMVKPMIQSWVQNVGGGKFPSAIVYLRDGVSEGQYQHVLQQEVHDMKALLKTADPNLNIPFIVIVGSKRHHVRFFPEAGTGDQTGNPLPGTLVETGVTHPFENDFYLCAHKAIKGTARPTHYQVLMNEAGMSNDQIHTMIYEHSYQYIRATTPVSIHPAIYYAHLASNRAVPHDPKWGGSSDGTPSVTQGRSRSGSQSGSQGGKSGGKSGSSSGVPTDIEKLMPMPNQGGIMTSMWYI